MRQSWYEALASSHRRVVVLAIAVVLGMGVAGCARKERLVTAPVVSAPKYPDFLFPTAPAETLADVKSRHERGWQFLQAGDLKNARNEFEAALRRQPAFYPSSTGLAYVELADNKPEPALDRFEKTLKAAADYIPALVGRGEALLALGRSGEALEAFEGALTETTDESALADVRRRVDVLRFQHTQSLVTSARQAAAAGRHDQARQIYLKAIQASPESAFLYREAAAQEREAGDLDAALEHLRRASDLDTADPKVLVEIGDIYESRGEVDAAMTAYAKALQLDPSLDVAKKIDALKERTALASLPAEYRAIETAPQLTRGALAALVGVNLGDIIIQAGKRPGAIVATDTRNHWAANWIIPVVSAGVMEVYPNHTFQPGAIVRRSDMAQAVSRVLNLIALKRPRLSAEWRKAPPRVADVPASNLAYPAVALAVSSGVMPVSENGNFYPVRPVTGAEAVAAVQRLRQLGR